MIELGNVTKTYVLDKETAISPVRDITLNVSEGEFILIIGRSGSGKTTLLNIAAGLIKPTSGKVRIASEDVWGMSDKELSLLRAQKIGFIFQFPSLLPSLSVLENVVLPTRFAAANQHGNVYDRAAKLLDTVGLSERMDVYPRQLSSGEQKRVVIARALINKPSILLADEPTSDLDELTEHEIMSLLKEIHTTGLTILMVTHNLDLVTYASRVLRMENGNLLDLTARKQTIRKNGNALSREAPVSDTTFAQ